LWFCDGGVFMSGLRNLIVVGLDVCFFWNLEFLRFG